MTKYSPNPEYQKQHWERSYGSIPNGWDYVTIGSLFTERQEKSSNMEEFPLYSFTIQDGVTPNTERYERSFLLKSEENEFSVVRLNDFVFNPMNLRFGAISYSRIKMPVSVSAYYNVLIAQQEKIDHDYMETFFRSHPVMNLYDRIAIGSLIEKRRVHLSILEKTFIPLPPIKEQKAIGETFRKWDRSIDLTQQLIAEKRLRRKGLMQQLLTGKRRLPGFAGEWRKVRLGDIFRNRTESGRTDLSLVSIAADRGVIPRDEIYRKDSSSEDKSKYLRICPGDIGYNTMRMWQGVSGLSSVEGIVSPAYTIVTPRGGIFGEFMAILFKFQPVVHLFYRHSQGLVSDTWNLKFRHFARIKVTIPDDDEQKAIAKVFQSIDRELELLQTKVNALREQKKGLMQQLLTGKKRVKV